MEVAVASDNARGSKPQNSEKRKFHESRRHMPTVFLLAGLIRIFQRGISNLNF
jgi:hypothetical protein